MNTQLGSPRPPGRAGYSMIELLTALVIVALVMAFAAPAMGRMLTSYRTQSSVEQVRNDLMYARMLAIRSGRSASLRISGNSYSLTVDTSTTSTALANQKLVRSVNLGTSKDNLVTITAAQNTITFDSRGLVRAGSGTVKIQRGTTIDSLTISPVGRIYRAQ